MKVISDEKRISESFSFRRNFFSKLLKGFLAIKSAFIRQYRTGYTDYIFWYFFSLSLILNVHRSIQINYFALKNPEQITSNSIEHERGKDDANSVTFMKYKKTEKVKDAHKLWRTERGNTELVESGMSKTIKK